MYEEPEFFFNFFFVLFLWFEFPFGLAFHPTLECYGKGSIESPQGLNPPISSIQRERCVVCKPPAGHPRGNPKTRTQRLPSTLVGGVSLYSCLQVVTTFCPAQGAVLSWELGSLVE